MRPYAGDKWELTSGNEGYEYDDPADEYDDETYRGGFHRQCATVDLTVAEWQKVMEDRCMDPEDGKALPDRFEAMLGSLTGEGLLGGVAIGDTGGWGPDRVIDACFYVSLELTPEASARQEADVSLWL